MAPLYAREIAFCVCVCRKSQVQFIDLSWPFCAIRLVVGWCTQLGPEATRRDQPFWAQRRRLLWLLLAGSRAHLISPGDQQLAHLASYLDGYLAGWLSPLDGPKPYADTKQQVR